MAEKRPLCVLVDTDFSRDASQLFVKRKGKRLTWADETGGQLIVTQNQLKRTHASYAEAMDAVETQKSRAPQPPPPRAPPRKHYGLIAVEVIKFLERYAEQTVADNEMEVKAKECVVYKCESDGIYRHRDFPGGELCARHNDHAKARPRSMLFHCACGSCKRVLDSTTRPVSHVTGNVYLCSDHELLQYEKNQCDNCSLMCKAGRQAGQYRSPSTCINCMANGIKRRRW